MKTKRGESRLHGKKSVIGLEIQWLYFVVLTILDIPNGDDLVTTMHVYMTLHFLC